jgi:hypothetical protein
VTVNELIEILESWPDKEDQVFLSSDAEGNEINAISAVEYGFTDKDGYSCDPDDERQETDKACLIVFPE